MDRIHALETFIKVVEYKGFSAAAWQLNTSPATLTKTIQALEAELGFKLFHRTTRQVTLTDQGRAYYPLAVDILERFTNAKKRIKNESTEVSGLIRIALPSLMVRDFLLSPLSTFLEAHPKISIELLPTHHAPSLVSSGEADFAFSTYKIQDHRLHCDQLFSSKRVLAASPSYLKKRGAPQSIFDLRDHDCLVNTTTHPEAIWEFGKNKIQVHARLRSPAPLSLIDAAVAGIGILWIAPFFIENLLKNKLLKIIPIDTEENLFTLYLCYPSLAKQDKTRLLVEFLLKKLVQK